MSGQLRESGVRLNCCCAIKTFRHPLDVSRKKLNGAKEGDKVLAKLPVDKYVGYSAEVISIFGNAGDPNVELESIAAQFDLRKIFQMTF